MKEYGNIESIDGGIYTIYEDDEEEDEAEDGEEEENQE